MTSLVLASASPARLATLKGGRDRAIGGVLGGRRVAGHRARRPSELALRLAELKCAAVAGEVSGDRLVLGCDSVLELDGLALGKPADADAAVARWQAMRGRSGVLHTGHCLRDTVVGPASRGDRSTVVHFADVTDDEISAYVESGEPLQVAGAFTIDGLGGAFVDRHRGRPPQRRRHQPAAAA